MKWIAKIHFFFIISLISVGLFSCDPNEVLPPETILTYEGYQLYPDSTGNLAALNMQVRFQKGNGNIGLEGRDTMAAPFIGKYTHNLYVHLFDKISDSVYVPLQNTLLPPEDIVERYCIPRLSNDRGSRGSSIKGTLEIIFKGGNFTGLIPLSQNGVIRYEIYMYSRDVMPNGIDLEQSNIVITDDIRIR